MKTGFLLILCLFTTPAFAGNNFHMIDSNTENGFAIYRTSKPSQEDLKYFCKLGIEEMLVMSGDADERELKFGPEACPTLKVIYNVKQNVRVPLNASFLKFFDDWVSEARAKGKKIAFRCLAGAHRTGRLAAYYQMKYQGLTARDATAILYEWGKIMWMSPFRKVKHQVQALEDYVRMRSCSTDPEFCVRPE